MKDSLPQNHSLPQSVVDSSLVEHVPGEGPSLTDVQFEALESGIASGQSALVVAPTSSGKTGAGMFAICGWLSSRQPGTSKAVYLVSHRALARQKFEEFLTQVAPLIGLSPHEVIMATGDAVLDGEGQTPPDPLSALVTIATYEKYLGLLSSGGIIQDMSHICFVCDELQLIADESRGANVEILLTLIKRAERGQFVGLSAVIDRDDSQHLADWLEARLIRVDTREVPLVYELRTPSATYEVSTERPEDSRQVVASPNRSTLQVLEELVANGSDDHTPVVVFCTRRQDVFDLARQWVSRSNTPQLGSTEALIFDEMTSSADDLSEYIPRGFAFHTADLVDVEREAVEGLLERDDLKVIFATTTLAYGLNFSFQTVIIHSWRRWHSGRRQHEPISPAEFHNMAGRAGRLGHADNDGRVIYFASDHERALAAQYLDLERMEHITPRLDPAWFDQIALQLLSSGIVNTDEGLFEFLKDSYSSFREQDTTQDFEGQWQQYVENAVRQLQSWGFVR